MLNPESHDWNRFWGQDKVEKFARISWSKKRILDILKPYTMLGKKALDAGCGSGFFSKAFCDAGMDVVSIDYSDKALEMTRKLTQEQARVIKIDLLDSGFNRCLDEKFDLIFSDGLLEHFELNDQKAILSNLGSVLTAGGVLVTFVPNLWSPWQLIRPFFMPGIHESPLVLSELVELHNSSDLSCFCSGGINVVPFRFSPDKLIGRYFGMLLYVIVRKE